MDSVISSEELCGHTVQESDVVWEEFLATSAVGL